MDFTGVTGDYIFAGLVFSIMINIFIIMFFMISGIGKDAWRRFFWKKKHRKGGYAYSLLATKDGNIQEVFAKVDEGHFEYEDKPYIRNPRITRTFRGIPAHFHREDEPEPKDPWDPDQQDALLSCGEMDTVMTAQVDFDFKTWFESVKPYLIMGGFVLAAVLVAGLVFGYLSWQHLRDGVSLAQGALPQVTPT